MASFGVIFDLDGTLAYTMDDLTTAINNMLTNLGYKTRSKTELLKFINNGAREFVRRSLPKLVQDSDFIVDSAVDVYETEYKKCYLEKTHPYDGIIEVLENLKSDGVKIAVLSNKQDSFVKDIIYKLFGKNFFSVVQGQTPSMPTKPDPVSSFYICKQMGVKPSNCFFVGDSDVDVKTAKNAGMTSIGVLWGYRAKEVLEEAGADFTIEAPVDLQEVLKAQILLKKQNSKKK